MATTLPTTSLPTPYTGASVVLTMTAATVAGGNKFTASGRDLVIAQNTGASPHNITLTSVADPYGRSGNVVEAIAAGAIRAYNLQALMGWVQTDGTILISADHIEVKFGILALP